MEDATSEMMRRVIEDMRRHPEIYDKAAELMRNSLVFDVLRSSRAVGEPFKNFGGAGSGIGAYSESMGKLLSEALTAGSTIGVAIKELGEREAYVGRSFSSLMEKPESFSAVLDGVNKSGPLSALLPTQGALESLAAAIKTPWPDVLNASWSIESLVCLHSVGRALSLSPYEGLGNAAIHSMFGDWKRIKIPGEVYLDWQARLDFYRKTGFDERLTALPEPAFTQSLSTIGIVRADLFSPAYRKAVGPPADEEDKPQEAVKRRMVSAFDVLFSFETQVREYLVEAMTERYGPEWDVHRVPGKVLNDWRRKRQEAVSKGEPRQPLICYADFTDYVQIIVRKDNWEEIFAPVFCNSDDAAVSFRRLHPIRLCTMHARPITKDDFLLLLVETQRILKALSSLKKG